MRVAIILILTFSKLICSAQDTIFYDTKWKPTSRSNAKFFRIEKKEGNKWKVKDYYLKTKKLQMKGTFSSLAPEIKDGYFEWYHSNGKLKQKGNYSNNKNIGEDLWFGANGSIAARVDYTPFGQIKKSKCFFDKERNQTDSLSAKYIAYCMYKDTISFRGTMKVTTISGQLDQEAEFSDLKKQIRDGLSKFYFDNGQLKSSTTYKEGVLHGEDLRYHVNGQLKSYAKYVQGQIFGELTTFYSFGQLKRKDYYDKGRYIKGNCYTATGQDTAHFAFIIDPEYAEGEAELIKFISSNIKYPKEAKKKQLGGRVLIGFTIDTNGKLLGQHVIQSIDPLLDNEALRVVNLLNNWTPGQRDGEKIEASYCLPFSFSF